MGFTILELLVVIVIIAIIVSLSVVALGSARAKARDGARIADMKTLQNALELYRQDEGGYPAALTFGQPLVGPSSGLTYMKQTPTDPLSPSQNYVYAPVGSSPYTSYAINYTLEGSTPDTSAGGNTMTPGSLTAGPCTPNCAGQCSGGSNGCGGTCSSNDTPADAANLAGTASNTQIALTWNAVPNAASYQICQSTSNNSCVTSFVSNHTAVTNSYTATGLTNGTTYYFTVKAVMCSSSVSANPSNQISAAPFFTCGDMVADATDAISYHTVWIDINQNSAVDAGECWFQDNLRTTLAGSINPSCPPNATNDAYDCTNLANLGYNYNFADATSICPSGWHIPTYPEFANLIEYAHDGTYNSSLCGAASGSTCSAAGGHLKETGTTWWSSHSAGADNSTSFDARGAGWWFGPIGPLYGYRATAILWTSTDVPGNPTQYAKSVYMQVGDDNTYYGETTKSSRLSVRCVK